MNDSKGSGNIALVLGCIDHDEPSLNYASEHVKATVLELESQLKSSASEFSDFVRRIDLLDPDDAVDRVRKSINEFLATHDRRNMILIYGIGHGTALRGKFLLSTQKSGVNQSFRDSDWLDFSRLLQIVHEAPFNVKVIILDSCQSGEVVGKTVSTFMNEMFLDRESQSGIANNWFILSSVSAHESAFYEKTAVYPNFSGDFIDILRNGRPGSEMLISLSDLASDLRTRATRAGRQTRPKMLTSVDDSNLYIFKNRKIWLNLRDRQKAEHIAARIIDAQEKLQLQTEAVFRLVNSVESSFNERLTDFENIKRETKEFYSDYTLVKTSYSLVTDKLISLERQYQDLQVEFKLVDSKLTAAINTTKEEDKKLDDKIIALNSGIVEKSDTLKSEFVYHIKSVKIISLFGLLGLVILFFLISLFHSEIFRRLILAWRALGM